MLTSEQRHVWEDIFRYILKNGKDFDIDVCMEKSAAAYPEGTLGREDAAEVGAIAKRVGEEMGRPEGEMIATIFLAVHWGVPLEEVQTHLNKMGVLGDGC